MLDDGLKPILCIGESKDEYEAGLNKEVKRATGCEVGNFLYLLVANK